MEVWIPILLTICCIAVFRSLFHKSHDSQHKQQKHKVQVPPGPSYLGLFRWLRKNSVEMDDELRSMFAKYGTMITLPSGGTTSILVSSPTLAHQALIQSGAAFADRPEASLTDKVMSSSQHTVSSARYGPTWRILRRNISTFLHPSRVKNYSRARKRALQILFDRLEADSKCHMGPNEDAIEVFNHLQYTIFSLLSFMCYGETTSDISVAAIENAIHRYMQSLNRFGILDMLPRLGKILFPGRWKELLKMRKDIEDAIIPLIRARRKAKENPEIPMKEKKEHSSYNVPVYVDTLLEVELEEDGGERKLTEDEMVSLCFEFATAGGDTTSAVFLWIMANIVKYPDIQAKVLAEVKGVIGDAEEVNEEDLPKMPYLRAVILEALRRHPAGHFVLPHRSIEDVELGGYSLPKGTVINFMSSEIAWDPKVWEDPMKFKPKRFLNKEGEEAFDITGTREIKTLIFGAGRRICPGYSVAIMHLEYFVANLVLKYEWKAAKGEEIDMSERHTPFIVMEHPLRVVLSTRSRQLK